MTKKLYIVNCGIGDYYVIAEHPTEAQDKVQELIKKAGYGKLDDWKVKKIELLAEEFEDIKNITGRFLIT